MKVLQVLPSLQGGGVEVGTLEIARALVAAGHDSWVLSAGGGMVARLQEEGSRHVEWNLGKKSLLNVLQIRKLRRWLAQEKFDLVHVRSRMPAWVVYLAWKKMPVSKRPRLMSSVHGLHSVSRYSAIMCCGERVIVVSKTAREYVTSNYPDVDPSKLRLVYRGIDPARYPWGYQATEDWKQKWFQQYPQLRDQFVVTLPGRITRLKGHLVLLKVVRRLLDSGTPVKAVIVGGDDPNRMGYRKEIDEAIQQAGLQEAVVFTGQRSDMRDIYSVSNVVLSLSTKPESFGRTVLEALSLGVPVVGFAHGGVGEILAALYPDGAVALGDEAGVAEAITQLKQGKAGDLKQNNLFLLSNMQQQTLSVYRELVP
ncbi:glycosyltransferase family 4 protein [Ketobacter sp. MCCC 1A13808]|uniref:glycosyltransferase family 4 protein n=1 Tax=Ketobacter sp. MCCC 1A13808 TaxID=2602738 RepID=UPI000F1E1AD5|nr:glycosyltransferase family 4 protein [Ketobacter sp. MCCC 1A13808]MVF11751.1 glycosyltransferase family 4 protein [Ketobacter sp. MCCC 1A13808]RLP55358.1 MAG: glycosyltransferase [Ketobacter sp.]